MSYTEVPFGGQTPKGPDALPWDADRQVVVPQVDFAISGYIDRLDLSETRDRARVIDYKSGKLPSDDGALRGGRELQRCLYAFAVRALLGRDIAIDAALLFPKAETSRHLDDPQAVLGDLTVYLLAARDNLRGGRALIGPDNGGDYDDFAFALPANAANSYVRRKSAAVAAALGDAATVWDAA
ncbi:MAG: PD-(D/E)XK nuclease family protein [Sphingomonadaceae bacterium]|nr:PD-(D/E)XK nuclease family protein [Sphingomonadaceae bacterium]